MPDVKPQPLSEQKMQEVKQENPQPLSQKQMPKVKQEFDSDPQQAPEKQIPEGNKESDATNPQPLSKSALKKIAKRQSWLDTKAERKSIQKQKRKEKVELNRKRGVYEMSYSGSTFILTFQVPPYFDISASTLVV